MTSVPLPTSSANRVPFQVELELEIPAQLFVAQDHWRALQVMTRLQSPTEPKATPDACEGPAIADRLREVALSVAHRVKVRRDEFARECLLANSLMVRAPGQRVLERLLALLAAVDDDVTCARSRMDAAPGERSDIAQERALTAEFVSNQLLEFLFHARRAIDERLRSGGPHSEGFAETAAAFDRAVQDRLQREVEYRTARGFVTPTSDDPRVLERYLERNSQLKKHFQELLFLATETSSPDAQLKSYGRFGAAMVASMFGFALTQSGVVSQSASLGLVVAALVGAIVYAVQDRLKKFGETYVPTQLGKRYAQRVTRLIAPPRRHSSDGKLVATVAESITSTLHHRPDPLNPELGAYRPVHVVRYSSRGLAELQPELLTRGIVSLKQIFRYDLSWLFARLDDARKAVPVLSADGLRIAEALRRYRTPVRARLVVGHCTYERAAIAVLHKGGLDRLEEEPTLAPAAPVAPALPAPSAPVLRVAAR